MRTLFAPAMVLLTIGLHAQAFHKVYGEAFMAHPCFAGAPDGFYLAHGSGPELIKTDLDGQLLWSRRLEFNGSPVGIYRMAYLNGVLIVSGGHAAQQNFFAALDADGEFLWANAAIFGDIHMPTRILAADDGYLTVGHREYPTGGGWTFDITLCRWDAGGQLLWAKAIGDDIYDYYGWTALVLPGGDILVAGERSNTNSSQPLLARYNASGEQVWMKLLTEQSAFFTYTAPTDLVATSDGHFALVATTYNTFFNHDAHVLTFNDAGTVQWAKRLYQVGWTEMGGSIIEDEQQLLVSGTHSEGNATSAHVARFSLDGTPVDVKTLPYFRSNSASGYYNGLGQDLFRYAPDNFVLAGECTAALGSASWHGLASFRFPNDPACAAPAPYPFEYTDFTWVDSLITDATVATNITEAAVSLTSAAIASPQSDLCALLAVDDNAPAHPALALYPNPGEGSCTLVLSERPSAPVQVLDPAGRVVELPLRWTGAQQAQLDLACLMPGVYTVHVEVNGAWRSARLVKQ